MNGRVYGDVPGRITCIQSKGPGCVDHGIATYDMLEYVKYFTITPFDGFSDHAMLKLSLEIPGQKQTQKIFNLESIEGNYVWDNKSKEAFTNALNNPELTRNIKEIVDCTYNESQDHINNLCEKITRVYQDAAKLSLRRKKHSKTIKKNKDRQISQTYNSLKNQLNNLGKLLLKFPNDPQLRGNYISLKKNFRKHLKEMKIQHREQILEKIQALEDKNPTQFWNLINKIKEKRESKESIDPEIFLDYFKTIHSSCNKRHFNDAFAQEIKEKVNSHSLKIWSNTLDKSINHKEISDACKKLKNKKACGFDKVSNEMIKYSLNIMMPVIHLLFNKIIQSELFPKTWSNGYIMPIFKSGDDQDPSNYRGITISNCLSKLFTKIMTNRLLTFLEENKIIKPNQIGFMPKNRTTDHILVLKTIIDSFKRSKKTLYLCFIDLQKAFDTIYHDGLIHKLQSLNFSNKFIKIIQAMYNDMTAKIKTSKGYTTEFPIKIGTKQGCNLSPLLFNLYLNDLPDILKSKTDDKIILDEMDINCLLYADDIVILSKTESGLKSKLKSLESYCNNWRLSISVRKSKILIINAPKKKTYNFKIYNTKLEVVEQYTYLGIIISNTCDFKSAVEELKRKATSIRF